MKKLITTALAPLAVAGLLVTAAAKSAPVPGPRPVADADAAGLYGGGCMNVFASSCDGTYSKCQLTKGNDLGNANPKGSTPGTITQCSSDGSTLCDGIHKNPVPCVTPKKSTSPK